MFDREKGQKEEPIRHVVQHKKDEDEEYFAKNDKGSYGGYDKGYNNQSYKYNGYEGKRWNDEKEYGYS